MRDTRHDHRIARNFRRLFAPRILLDRLLRHVMHAVQDVRPIVKRQEILGRHDQDRIDAARWLEKYRHLCGE